MNMGRAFIWSSVITISLIVIANILATEYRIKREKAEAKKISNIRQGECAPCPDCINN